MSIGETLVRGGLSTRVARVALGALLAVVAATALAASASAAPVIAEYSVGSTNPAAGAHPDLIAKVALDEPGEPEVARDIKINLPPGLFGNPGAIFKCSSAEFVLNHCSPGTQAGLISLIANYEDDPNYVLGTVPVYNLETVGGETARLAFVAPTVNIPISIPITVRSDSDYGIDLNVRGIPQDVPLGLARLTIWGLPAAKSHDTQRFGRGEPGEPSGCEGVLDTSCLAAPFPSAGKFVEPYINNPSVCTGAPLPISISVVSYQDTGNSSEETASFPATTECETQKFDPVFKLGLTNTETDAPTGLDIQLQADQFLGGEASSQSTLRSAIVHLPPGLTINPDAADGQTSCTEAEAGFGTEQPGNCPDNSKIGTVEVLTPALEGPLTGSLYIGKPVPGDQYRVFMIFDGFGVHAKLFASFLPDPETGELTMQVLDLPQVPFSVFNLHLFASDRGLLATPTHCTVYQANAVMTPWNDQLSPQESTPTFGVDSGPNGRPCPGITRPFNPRLEAGTTNPSAGEFSNFILKLDRDDGDQFLGDLTFRMPPGFTGDLSGISYCPDQAIAHAAANQGLSEQASPSCPASSQVGSSNVAAGPGEHPFHAVGKMYLAGPFKGAPLSIVALTPALAGPYDYGVVAVRVALHVDPQTAQVFAASDTVPAVIGGIPIRMRSIQVNIDKPNFTINPTNCSPFTVDSQGIGDQGTITDFSSYFQVVNCMRLAFKPTMKIRQVGKKGTKRGANPVVKFDLNTRAGDANIKSLTVTLPKAYEIDQGHLGNICSEKELIEKECAGRTAIGRASTETPLLDNPLSGPVYAVSGSGGLPRLAFLLNGQVNLLPRADTKAVGGKLQTTVPVIPDAPIGHFGLVINGGKTGYLALTRGICKHQPVVKVAYAAQNGLTRTEKVKVKAACGKKKKKKKK